MKPTIGRIVWFNTPHGYDRPAMITQVWSDTCVSMVVFLDGPNDVGWVRPETANSTNMATEWEGSVYYSEQPTPRTWRWPERTP